MKINYSDEPVIKGEGSIFLAGPTPRDGGVESWRPHAIGILRKLGHTGLVYVPEIKVATKGYDYTSQVPWELSALGSAGVVAFWVPRQIDRRKRSLGMPGFTTNVEFGFHLGKNQEKVTYGRPDNAPKTRYLDEVYTTITSKEPHRNIESLLEEAVRMAKTKVS